MYSSSSLSSNRVGPAFELWVLSPWEIILFFLFSFLLLLSSDGFLSSAAPISNWFTTICWKRKILYQVRCPKFVKTFLKEMWPLTVLSCGPRRKSWCGQGGLLLGKYAQDCMHICFSSVMHKNKSMIPAGQKVNRTHHLPLDWSSHFGSCCLNMIVCSACAKVCQGTFKGKEDRQEKVSFWSRKEALSIMFFRWCLKMFSALMTIVVWQQVQSYRAACQKSGTGCRSLFSCHLVANPGFLLCSISKGAILTWR